MEKGQEQERERERERVDGRDSFNATFLCYRSSWKRQVMTTPGDEEKDRPENRRRFSTTTRIKDNPIRLELIPGELHFTSAKYYVMPLLLYTAAAACFSFTAPSFLRRAFAAR